MSRILAIDQSTSATKALLYDQSATLLDKVSIEHRQIYPQPGFVEHDAEEIWRNTLSAVAELFRRQPKSANELICLSITNQRETFVLFDRATGRPLHPAVVWQCRRGESICDELRKANLDPIVARKTGLRIDTYFPAPKLAWLLRSNRALAGKLADGTALFGTIDAYLIYRLTGGKVFACDHTNASRTLLLDIHSLAWNAELCEMFGVPMKCLPQARDSTAQFGSTTLDGILKTPIPICGVMGDSQASLLAHRCLAAGQAKVTLGSGSSILLNTGARPGDLGDGIVSTIAWTHRGKPTYCMEGIISYSAATIGWLRDQLGLIRSPEETDAAATAEADNGGVYLVPAFAGLSAPYWAPSARAAIVGLSAHSNRNHVLRAALESIGYQLRDVLQIMRDRGGGTLGGLPPTAERHEK